MKAICSRCHKDLGEREPRGNPGIVRMMCAECLQFLDKEWRGMTVGGYLDTVDEPIILVNEERRMVSCNKSAEKLLGKPRGEMRGLLTGEFIECENSVLSEGCGSGVHCSACVLRNSINHTVKTGKPLDKVPAHMNWLQNGLPVIRHITVSTEKSGEFIMLQISGRSKARPEDGEPGPAVPGKPAAQG